MAIKYDFHIHSCLSPCSDDDMTPANIAGMAYLAGLNAIAVTDHNSAKNILSVTEACKQYNIKVLCGIEVCTSEEIHVLCYFGSTISALAFGDMIEKNSPHIKNRPEKYGNQLVMDSADKVLSNAENLLITACNYSLCELVDICHNMGGVCWYAHIDKQSFSVISVLGALPPDIDIDGVEIYNLANRQKLIEDGFIGEDTPYMTNSDAHTLGVIGEKEQFLHHSHPIITFMNG